MPAHVQRVLDPARPIAAFRQSGAPIGPGPGLQRALCSLPHIRVVWTVPNDVADRCPRLWLPPGGAGPPAQREMPVSVHEPIYILGAGAVGFPLAAYLAAAGRRVLAVRTSRQDLPLHTSTVTVQSETQPLQVPVETVSLARLALVNGTIVIAAKAHANPTLARALRAKAATGPLVLLQNGIGVERPFLEAQFTAIYRGVVYSTSQATADDAFRFRAVMASPIGVIAGDAVELQTCIDTLTTAGFPFRAEAQIEREIWKKAIINTVFNSICPLLDVDNGVFARDDAASSLAAAIVSECVTLTDRLGLGLSERELMEQIVHLSRRSAGQLISTLQDMRAGRETEIAFLNLELERVAAALNPKLELPQVGLLGRMIVAKTKQQRRTEG